MTDLRNILPPEAVTAIRAADSDHRARATHRELPERLRDRDASTLSPAEAERVARALGVPARMLRDFESESQFQADPAAVARRQADIDKTLDDETFYALKSRQSKISDADFKRLVAIDLRRKAESEGSK